ncbi:TPA: hypothetical protein NIJ29_004095 [Pseudomonas aeruginosa]|nr:hypothetical protein [Pseudomonas aeruginosa]
MSKSSTNYCIFLDFDGVLHPDRAYMGRKGPALTGDGDLFMWLPTLEKVLADFPQCEIVLSTNWVRMLGFKRACKYLPEKISGRVVGATWHSAITRDPELLNWWDTATRYEQICRYVASTQIENWVAIDDDVEGWPDVSLSRLVACKPQLGLGELDAAMRLREILTGQSRADAIDFRSAKNL